MNVCIFIVSGKQLIQNITIQNISSSVRVCLEPWEDSILHPCYAFYCLEHLVRIEGQRTWTTSIVFPGTSHCCHEKEVHNVTYMLVEKVDTTGHGCMENCVYEDKENPGSRLCFQTGEQPVTCMIEHGGRIWCEHLAILTLSVQDVSVGSRKTAMRLRYSIYRWRSDFIKNNWAEWISLAGLCDKSVRGSLWRITYCLRLGPYCSHLPWEPSLHGQR